MIKKLRKKTMICFYKGDICNDIHILDELDSNGFEVHLFNDLDETNLKYDILFDVIKNLYGNNYNEYDIYISSNIGEFIMLQNILYKNFVVGFLYINNNPMHMKLDNLYKAILDKEKENNVENFYVLKKE